MMTRRDVRPVIALLLVVLLACSSRQAADEPAPSDDVEVAVEIENHNWSDVVIFLVRGSQRFRLGVVSSLGTSAFSVPFRQVRGGASTLLAHPIGGARDVTSDQLHLQPGQMIHWTLEADLSRSSLGVY
jgi:hypothetical protein